MISKQDVIQMLDKWVDRLDESSVSEAIECVLLMVKNKIENMPERNVWIPCSERLPEEDGQYLCFVKKLFGQVVKVYKFGKDLYKVDSFDFNKDAGPGFYEYDFEWGYLKCVDVIAWMPLPEQFTFKCEDEESERQQSDTDWKKSMMGHFTKVE